MPTTPSTPPGNSLQDLLDDVTFAEIVADGIITIEEIEAAMRAKGIDPYGDDD